MGATIQCDAKPPATEWSQDFEWLTERRFPRSTIMTLSSYSSLSALSFPSNHLRGAVSCVGGGRMVMVLIWGMRWLSINGGVAVGARIYPLPHYCRWLIVRRRSRFCLENNNINNSLRFVYFALLCVHSTSCLNSRVLSLRLLAKSCATIFPA